jgi:hypothetical protein
MGGRDGRRDSVFRLRAALNLTLAITKWCCGGGGGGSTKL